MSLVGQPSYVTDDEEAGFDSSTGVPGVRSRHKIARFHFMSSFGVPLTRLYLLSIPLRDHLESLHFKNRSRLESYVLEGTKSAWYRFCGSRLATWFILGIRWINESQYEFLLRLKHTHEWFRPVYHITSNAWVLQCVKLNDPTFTRMILEDDAWFRMDT